VIQGLITRGLSEMTRIGVAYGANPLTFLSLAGVGDLFLTCSSSTSRNYTVGYRLGRGESLEVVLQTIGSVAEGVTTAKGLKVIVDDLDVPAPLANAVRLFPLVFHTVCGRLIRWTYVRSMKCYMKVSETAI
jgi:glycerol-3-phosphate dehydrogenase